MAKFLVFGAIAATVAVVFGLLADCRVAYFVGSVALVAVLAAGAVRARFH